MRHDGTLTRLIELSKHRRRQLERPRPETRGTGGRTPSGRGYPLATGFENMAQQPDDRYLRAHDRNEGVAQAVRDCIAAWETGLVEHVERDGDARFDIVRPR